MFRDFFYLHKSDRRVILALLSLAAVAFVVFFLVGGKSQNTSIPSKNVADSLHHEALFPSSIDQTVLSPFDPNTADSTQLRRLGLAPFIVQNIYKYRAARGIFREKADFARLYGLTVKQYRELEPYITISSDYQPASTLFPRHSHEAPAVQSHDTTIITPRYPVKLSEGEMIDLATADTTTLRRIPGIGPYFARRIIDYGQRLGGYVSVEQLDEIDDFPQEAKQYITISNPTTRKLNINSLSLNELRRHPYINYYQARAIIDYRRQYGPIGNLYDLHLLPDFPEEAIQRLLPYVEY